MATHDHKYLLELSIKVKDRFPTLQDLDIFGDASRITEEYGIVEEISFFSVEPRNYGVAKLRSSIEPYLNPEISETEKELARQSVMSKKEQSETTNTEKNTYNYKFFPALISDEDAEEQWNSYVVGIKYNNSLMLEEIDKHRTLFLSNALIMMVVFSSFILIVVYLLRKFEHMAYHDQLTGLANRKLLEEKFDSLTREAETNKYLLAVFFLDFDNFKEINDNYGHDSGDLVLKEMAKRLEFTLNEMAIVSRLGGDEFVMAVTGFNSRKDLNKLSDRIIEELTAPILIEDSHLYLSASVGISLYREDGIELEELIQKADSAMYRSKKTQKDYIIYKNC
ncbi:MAG: diguanylate cyclase domain-containing protein [bacterium]